MTHVVTEACIRCKYTDGVAVCPVDAIFRSEDVPADQQHYFEINARLASRWPAITGAKAALPDADYWAQVQEKAELLDEVAGDAH